MKPSVLFILHLPNPVHGASMVGKYIKESSLVNSEFSTTFINLSTSTSVTEINKMGWKKIYTILRIQSKIIRAILSKRYDLCYMTLTASGPGFYKDLLIVALLKLFNKKIIYHFHNKGVSVAKNSYINNILYKFTFNKSKSILLSKLLYQDIEYYVKKDDVYFCANGVPELKETSNQNIQIPAIKTTCQLLFLSNMMVDKGAFVLLEALKILATKNVSYECNFVGAWTDITEQDFNTKIVSYGLEGKVFAHGPKYGQDKAAFLKNTDVFVFPTYYHYETFGLVNLEAMQYNLPIVSTYEGGIPDVIIDGETGFLVHQKNILELADKLKLLIENPELRVKMGLAGKERFLKYFTLNAFETNLTQILKSVAISN